MPIPALIAGVGALAAAGIGAGVASSMSRKNLKSQEEQQSYDRWAQEQTWMREDKAVQRRVADLKAAGMSPVLAAGQAAETGHPIQSVAPQMDVGRMNFIQNFLAAVQMQKNIARTVAETDFVREKVESEKQNRDVQIKDLSIRQGTHKINLQRLALDTRGMNIKEKQVSIELARLGYEGERLQHEAKRIANDSERVRLEGMRVFNDSQRVAIEKNRSEILNALDQSRKGLTDEYQLSERLRQIGLSWSTQNRILEYEVLTYDYLLSQNLGYRTKDTMSMMEKLNLVRPEAVDRARSSAYSGTESEGYKIRDALRSLRSRAGLDNY